MMNANFNQSELSAGAGITSPAAAVPTREDVLRKFFLGRLEYLLRLRDGIGESLKTADDLLIKRAIYSTYRDCLSLGAGDEARVLLGR